MMKRMIHGSVHEEELGTLSAQEHQQVDHQLGLDADADRVFFPFPRARVDDVFFLGAMLIAGRQLQ